MSYLVARVVTAEPPEQWVGELTSVWRDLWPRLDPVAKQWEAHWFARRESPLGDEHRRRIPRSGREDLLAAIERLEMNFVWLVASVACFQVQLHAVSSGSLEDAEPARTLFRGWPAALESGRQPRCLVLAISTEAATADLQRAWLTATRRLFSACRGMFAEMAVEPVLPRGSPYSPMHQSWTFGAARRIEHQAVPAPWLVLGPGHIEALGGDAAAHARLAEFDLHTEGVGLVVEVTDPLRPDPAKLEAIRQALAPLTMPFPRMPGLRCLIVTPELRGRLIDRGALPVRTLADGTIEIRVFDAYSLGGPRESPNQDGNLEAAHAMIPMFDLGSDAVTLHIPRAWGPINWLRLGRTAGAKEKNRLGRSSGRRGAIPWVDLGGRVGDPVPVTVLGAKPGQMDAIVGEWSNLVGTKPTVRGETLEIAASLAHGDPLMLLVLAIDRIATADDSVRGVVFGPVVPPEELMRQWLDGEALMGARDPLDRP